VLTAYQQEKEPPGPVDDSVVNVLCVTTDGSFGGEAFHGERTLVGHQIEVPSVGRHCFLDRPGCAHKPSPFMRLPAQHVVTDFVREGAAKRARELGVVYWGSGRKQRDGANQRLHVLDRQMNHRQRHAVVEQD